MKRIVLPIIALLTVVLVFNVTACGEEEETTTPTSGTTLPAMTLKLAHGHTTDDVLGSIVQEFVDRVSEATGGQLEIEVFPMGTLFSGFTLWTSMVGGQIDMVSCYDYVPAIADPEFYICGSPGLFSSWEQGYEFARHPDGGQKILEMMEAHGAKGLGMFPGSLLLVSLSREREVKSWHDMNGLRQMGYGGAVAESYGEITGMQAVYMSGSEVYSALAQGMIDLAQSSPDVAVRTRRHEVTKYCYVWSGLGVQNIEILMNKDVWNNLPAAYQEIIERIIDEMGPWALQFAMGVEETSLDELADSLTVHWESDEDRAEMMEIWESKLEARGYWDQFDPDMLGLARQIGGQE